MLSDQAVALANAVGGLAGVTVLLTGLFWMLATGRLGTGRELKEKDRRIATLETLCQTQAEQLNVVLREGLPATNALMTALRQAVEEHQ